MSPAPPQKPSDTQENRPQHAQPALLLCPASNTPHSCEQQGLAPVPALPHRPAPAQHSLMTRSVFSNNTTFFSVEIINICTVYAWPVQDKPLEGLVDGGLRLFPALGMCSSPLLPMLMGKAGVGHQEPCVLITVGNPNPAPVLWVPHTWNSPSFLTGTGELGLLRESSNLHCQLTTAMASLFPAAELGFCRKPTRTEVTATPSSHPRNSTRDTRDYGHKTRVTLASLITMVTNSS